MVFLGSGAFSYERGTPVQHTQHVNLGKVGRPVFGFVHAISRDKARERERRGRERIRLREGERASEREKDSRTSTLNPAEISWGRHMVQGYLAH